MGNKWKDRLGWSALVVYLVMLLAAIILSSCGPLRRLTDPKARVAHILKRNPGLLVQLVPADTVYRLRDSTIIMEGTSDTITISSVLIDTLRYEKVTIFHDSISGLKAAIWRDYANNLRLLIESRPDTVRVEWREKIITRTLTNTVSELPRWAIAAGGAALAVVLLAIIAIFVARK